MKHRLHQLIALGLVLMMLAAAGGVRAQDGGPRRPEAADGIQPQAAVGTAFTYQGRLTESGAPANGAYDMEFRLYDAASGGLQRGGVVVANDVAVSGGLFTAALDFSSVIDGSTQLYLDVAVRPGASTGVFTSLTPRQALNPAPIAQTLRAGATIKSDGFYVLDLTNTRTSFAGDGLWVTTSHSNSYGIATDGPGIAVVATTTSAANPAIRARGASATGTALELASGGIRVTGAGVGTTGPAFIHLATAQNTFSNWTTISHPLTNGDPRAILIVTPNWNPPGSSGVYNNAPIGVAYNSTESVWTIFNQNLAPMSVGAAFNVLVIKP